MPKIRSEKGPVCCPQCNKKLSRSSDLARHVRTQHPSVGQSKRYLCTVTGCDFGADQKSNFDTHSRAAHGIGELLHCDGCEKTFVDPAQLCRHRQAKHAAKPYHSKGYTPKKYRRPAATAVSDFDTPSSTASTSSFETPTTPINPPAPEFASKVEFPDWLSQVSEPSFDQSWMVDWDSPAFSAIPAANAPTPVPHVPCTLPPTTWAGVGLHTSLNSYVPQPLEPVFTYDRACQVAPDPLETDFDGLIRAADAVAYEPRFLSTVDDILVGLGLEPSVADKSASSPAIDAAYSYPTELAPPAPFQDPMFSEAPPAPFQDPMFSEARMPVDTPMSFDNPAPFYYDFRDVQTSLSPYSMDTNAALFPLQ
ncbi:hypothetical protein FA95DRAFT_440258 [Auriscalpium vulgare]|uniref:Uncharacterized protein n=1 Tax=Auriscalpium vulgare TaxID=40419 RepID=A0ACB8RGZ0_9AGAM|nr:hypothetical protein FA95DRAFT_440258 [Auriscalpium vulgare]